MAKIKAAAGQNIKKLKAEIKKLQLYKKYRLIKDYKEKYDTNWFRSLCTIKIMPNDYQKIFANVRINNIGHGCFYYNLDESIVIQSKGNILGNMSVDYSYILNNEAKNNEINGIIKDYIERINDPRITLKKPSDLQEALQAILFWDSLLWQTGHRLMGLGRLDKVLEKYRIPDNGEQLIKDFLNTLHKTYIFKSNVLKGDTGQIIILGGKEENGSYYSNEYTYLFIKCLKEIKIPDVKILLRSSSNMPEELLNAAIECIATGIGSPLISNDDVLIPNLQDFGYEVSDSYNYAVSACWEPLIFGKSMDQNNLGSIEFGRCMNETLIDGNFINCKEFNDVLDLYFDKLQNNINNLLRKVDALIWEEDPLLTLLMGLEQEITKGSAKYSNYGVTSVGMSAAVNSLLNIKNYVFTRNDYTLSDIREIIESNYKKDAAVFKNNINGFGTDNVSAIETTNLIIKKTERLLKAYRNKYQGKIKFGLSSPYYIDGSIDVGATLDGRKAGQPFQTHISRDQGDALTEIINFESQLCFTGISSNANVIDIIVQNSLLKDNIDKFVQYIAGGIKKGLFQIQFNVLSYAQLADAKIHPEKYPNLIVRVWGFSAYFNELPDSYKDNLIKRAREMEGIA